MATVITYDDCGCPRPGDGPLPVNPTYETITGSKVDVYVNCGCITQFNNVNSITHDFLVGMASGGTHYNPYQIAAIDQLVNDLMTEAGASEVEFYADFASFPVTGEVGKLYIDKGTLKGYYWTGAAYQSLFSQEDFSPELKSKLENIRVNSIYADATGLIMLTPSDIGAEVAGTAIGLMNAHLAAANPHPQYATDVDISAITGDISGITADLEAHILDTSNPHAVTKAQVGLGNVLNVDTTNPANIVQNNNYRFVTDVEKGIWNSKEAGGTAATLMADHLAAVDPHSQYALDGEKGQPNGIATLDGSGKLVTTQLPDLAVSDFLGSVPSEAAMLQLQGQKGDWAIRTDTGTTYIITGNPAVISGWTQLSYPAAPVSSVNGKVGAVTLNYADVGAAPATGGTGYIQSQFSTPQTAQFWITSNGTTARIVSNATGGNHPLQIQNTNNSASSFIAFMNNTGSGVASIGYANTGTAATVADAMIINGVNKRIVLTANDGTTAHATLATTGNLLIGTTTDNNSEKLQVNGSMVTQGAAYIGWADVAGTALSVRGGGSFLGTVSGGPILTVQNKAANGMSGTMILDNTGANAGFFGHVNSGSGATGQRNYLMVDGFNKPIGFDPTGMNVPKMVLTVASNLLIGTTTDNGTYKLQVNGGISTGSTGVSGWFESSTSAGLIIIVKNTTATGYGLIRFLNEVGGNKGTIGIGNTNSTDPVFGNSFAIATGGLPIKFSVDGSATHATLNTTGNLLIGTTTDNNSEKLQVNGSIYNVPTALATPATQIYVNDAGKLKTRTSAQLLGDLGAAPVTGGTGYIQNQNAVSQAATFNINSNYASSYIIEGNLQLIQQGATTGVLSPLVITRGGQYEGYKNPAIDIQCNYNNNGRQEAPVGLNINMVWSPRDWGALSNAWLYGMKSIVSADNIPLYAGYFKATLTATTPTTIPYAIYSDGGKNYFKDAVLVNTTTDNGVDKLQVNGSISSGSHIMNNIGATDINLTFNHSANHFFRWRMGNQDGNFHLDSKYNGTITQDRIWFTLSGHIIIGSSSFRGGLVQINGGALSLAQSVTDYTDNNQGSIWYRTDLNKFRGVDNTGYVNLATETWVTANFAPKVGIVEYADNYEARKAGLEKGDFYRTGDVLKVVW